ncbi:MAG: VTT domain-containing protein [Acidimicrobiales bacterium]
MLAVALALFDALRPERLLEAGGLALAAAIVFAESGLFFGFFLPGDSLLFVTGFLASHAGGERLGQPLWLILGVLFVAAAVGDQVGYVFGRRLGPALFRKPDARLFKQQRVHTAQRFFEAHGAKTIVLARFVPVVRTFAPIVAGASRMPYRTFVTFNLAGALVWAVGITVLGHQLGEVAVVRDNLEIAVLTVVAVSLLPVVIEFVRHRRRAASEG